MYCFVLLMYCVFVVDISEILGAKADTLAHQY